MESETKEKILLFGGSFDPVHLGHTKILQDAIDKIKPDFTYVVPSQQKLLSNRTLSCAQDRLEMAKIGFRDFKNLKVDDFEIKAKEKVYWIDTLKHFMKLHPHAEFYFLIGSDQLFNFKQWKQYDELLKLAKVVCYKRSHFCQCCSDIDHCSCKTPNPEFPDVIYLNDKVYKVSSTEMRAHPLKEWMDEKVLNYINDHGLYAVERLEKICKPSRFKHCLRVGAYAKDLMQNIDPNKVHLAYTAGVYHDISKDMPECRQVCIAQDILGIKDYVSWRVLHGWVGAFVLENDFLFKNQYVLNAIRRHTKPYDYHNEPLTELDKVVYLADKLEPMRTNEDVFGCDINYFRDLAKTDYERCFDELYTLTQRELSKTNKE